MNADWSKQEDQLGLLTKQAERYLTTFRWLWLFNLVALVIGVATRQYGATVVAAGSSLVALIGVALAKKGTRTVSETTFESHRIQHKLEP